MRKGIEKNPSEPKGVDRTKLERNMIIALVIAFVIAIGVVVVIVEFQDPKVTVTVSQEGEGTVDPSVGTHDFDRTVR
jgi:hypothetical protein